MSNMQPSCDNVKVGNSRLIDVECTGSITAVVTFPNKSGDVSLIMHDVAYIPDLEFNLFSLTTADQKKTYLEPENDEVTLSLLAG